MNTPTPRTDAAWSASFEGKQLSAGQTARSLRDCSQQLERELAALTAERDQLRADCENETKWAAHYLAESIAVKGERDQLRAENATLRAAQKACEACDEPTAFEVRQLRARAERAEADKARIDWLEAQENKRMEQAGVKTDDLPFLVLGEDGKTHWGQTYRNAIDAAMKGAAK